MERLSMDMTTTANKKPSLVKGNNTLYQLQLSCTPVQGQPTSWTVSCTFDEYRSLQRRLVKALRPGHKCNAECKWLVNVIKKHFPKASLFCKNYPSTVESRRLSLLRLMTTVKASLVNHGNVGCAIFRDHVSEEFAAFLVGDCKDAEDELTASAVSFTSDEENLVLDFEFDDDFADFECGLCGLSLDAVEEGEATCMTPYCTTVTFECGHQFHDLCVLPRLDEEAKCPLCK
ncbi:hypothetical protein PHYSODRAFT_504471 [Phytophthora sojae]|uniref:RING-type domain-containing protein n=1 Tax=Phytophthora sojae (strain P6497) TaxID=1094619 RepID=G4ZG79_PHYSP|nr:hypothetical protein PHYSODRAFT_504471 [Phytophthora sojae]EGZ17982.1 hypothetical protein PHYSODRAFT_504471 [Phytophthora sojae]|eukprot:XP_009527040.1 hypothetical protein PHYSODRAFT_504471 [Phytophthora sojae]